MTDRYDVVVVGGRCAGAPLAILLARAGLSVCVVDQARFPSDTASTHVVQPAGVQVLDRLGVLARVLQQAPAIERALLGFDGFEIRLDGSSELLGAPGVTCRRVTLDEILLDGAAAAGADVRTRTTVDAVVTDNGRVCGVDTTTGRISARLVVGADGVNSTVARQVGAREYHRADGGRGFVWGYWENATAPRDQMWFGKRGDHGYLAAPTDAGLFMAVAAFSAGQRERVLADRPGAHAQAMTGWPELHAALDGATRVGPLRTVADWHGYFRESAGPGWVLVGDAGHFKDPTPGQGIADALRQVERLAGAIEHGLDGGDPDAVLTDWWRWRDDDAWDMYWFASDLGAPGPMPPVAEALLRRMSRDPALAEVFFRVMNHEIPATTLGRPRYGLPAAASAIVRGRGRRREAVRELVQVQRTAAQRQRMSRTPALAATPGAARRQ
jgi:menaquinone-9 beta-reductase